MHKICFNFALEMLEPDTFVLRIC